MTDERGRTESETESGAPVDFNRLSVLETRLGTDARFSHIETEPDFAPDRLVCVYDSRWYPSSVQTARLEIVWFENGDFSLHYHETHENGAFDHRWDRHPSNHNRRDHIHPGPNAPTLGDDTTHPQDWRDVLSTVLAEIEIRQRGFWSD
ncbi:hypothetical protein [Halalkalicoccus subterraneus]|uniref:hypothetical protein n=1 Tax=Halalkalicoccus subterraneus TaxID=2675002 RepID=UPI000EFC6817|nr:hypothetical protein [Halalkalicoccus subterraneus]